MAKPHLGVVIVGHVDAGKSTTTGHLLFELGGLPERVLDKLRAEAEANGKGSFAFAYFLDKQKDERERGVTISCTTKEFHTDKFHYTIIDAPGHRDFIKNMISGASQADVAVLMVPANRGGFEVSLQKGNHKKGIIQGQTRQHARLLKLLGVEQVIVGVNKMDDTSVNYSEERFDEIKTEVMGMLTKIGFKESRIPVIPMSGFNGENLTKVSENMPWYKGYRVQVGKDKFAEGHTLVDALNNVARVPKRDVASSVVMPVSGMFKIRGIGDIITGRIERGILTPETRVKFLPSGLTGKVFTIEMHHKSQPEAGPGDNVGLNIKGLPKDQLPHVGELMVVENSTLQPTKQFTAVVMVQEHPGQLKPGFSPQVHVRTSKGPCKIVKINWRMGKKSTHGAKVEDPGYVEAYDQAEIVFEPANGPRALTTFKECPGLGRIAVMESNSLVMLGKITSVE